ncbi:unnamed protein product [Cercopithifilaria johnstoni]|uniref:TMC domain-containing protein n=1 Tax=Cercopithifilaria johnstoni TaxID=2874296 RepID=A0A8J2Q3H2_9BILA|nr:unnamed protein product [Cercopithifilaria johnstoni]
MQAGSVWAILANAVSITVSFITLTFPNFFDLISKMERYHPRTALRIQLGRVLFLYILNYYTLIISLMFMLNTMESQRNVDERLIPVTQYSVHHPNKAPIYNISYNQIIKQRTGRQVIFDFPSVASSLFNRSKFSDIPTTPSPGKLWTTVFPNFGPLGITNPKAVVTENRRGIMNASTFIAYPIGNNDWTKNISAQPTVLNYSTTVQAVLSAARLSTDWYEECWENLIGEEITKLVTTDLVMTIASILVIDFFRALWVRYTNIWWFWNLETTFPEYGEFKVAENVLHLVNNQGMIWLGLFFVPMLPAINNIKLIILMYIRGWAVMTCNVPARQIFRASRSSNFYLMLLLLMLFLCTLPVGYVIASKKPSKICGPFASQKRFYSVIVQLLDRNLTKGLVDAIRYMISPGIVIPVLLLLLLTIYFLFALVRGLREANTDLTKQLLHERTEEKKRIFELAGGKKRLAANNNELSRSPLLPKKSTDSTNVKNKISSYTDDEISADKSYKRSNRDLRSYVPSLKSVSEAEHSESDEEEPEQKLKEQQENDEKSEIAEIKRSWKQKIMTWLGLDKKPKRPRKLRLRYDHNDIEAGNGSFMSGKKSTSKSATSDDQRSITSITESFLHSSPSSEKLIEEEEGEIKSDRSVTSTAKNSIEQDRKRIISQQTFGVHETLMEKTVSLLEPTNDDGSDDSPHESPKEVENRGYDSSDLSDPRFSYADPYSSYANAMMSPLMEMQTLSPAIYSENEIEAEDEFDEGNGVTQHLEDYNRMDKPEKISHEEGLDGKSNVRQKVEQDEIRPNNASIIVHPEIHIPAMISDIDVEHEKEINQSLKMKEINQQIKLGKVEARVFLREAKPKSHHSETVQSPHTASDSESRMIVAGKDPRLYYTDSECVTSHGKHFQRYKKPIHYAIPYYSRVANTQEDHQTDILVQQFLMRVNISENRSGILPDRSSSHQPLPSLPEHHTHEAQSAMNKVQHTLNQLPLPSNETSQICKHTLHVPCGQPYGPYPAGECYPCSPPPGYYPRSCYQRCCNDISGVNDDNDDDNNINDDDYSDVDVKDDGMERGDDTKNIL